MYIAPMTIDLYCNHLQYKFQITFSNKLFLFPFFPGLTPLDILFSRPGGTEIKITDFSLARRIVGIVKLEYGQPEYVSPEIVNGEGASFASDLWAVGIITYLLLSGVSPFRGQVSQCSFKLYGKRLTFEEFFKLKFFFKYCQKYV